MERGVQRHGIWEGTAPEPLMGALPAGVEVTGHAFLQSPAPCCAQLALPFWAKVIGTLKSRRSEEVAVRISVTLLGGNGESLYRDKDLLILDPGSAGEFDVRVTEFNLNVKRYRVDVEELAEGEW